MLFFFMDVGLVIWAVALVVLTVRRRALPGVAVTLLWALLGAAMNLVVVLVVGLVSGGWAPLFVVFAIQAVVAFVVAVVVVSPLTRRLMLPGEMAA